jgi:hypothetical protein
MRPSERTNMKREFVFFFSFWKSFSSQFISSKFLEHSPETVYMLYSRKL